MDGLRGDARRGLRRPRAGHHRGEPPGAHPRQPADGAVEQVRLARAHDGQQVGDLGRLLDALRRHRRRLRGHQGRAQDARLRARRPPQRARRRAPGPAVDHRRARRAPSCAPTRRTRTRCPTTTRSTRSSTAYVEHDAEPRAARARRPARARRSTASSRSSTAPSTSAARRRPGSRSPRARSAATGACRSPTLPAVGTPALSAARCRSAPVAGPANCGRVGVESGLPQRCEQLPFELAGIVRGRPLSCGARTTRPRTMLADERRDDVVRARPRRSDLDSSMPQFVRRSARRRSARPDAPDARVAESPARRARVTHRRPVVVGDLDVPDPRRAARGGAAGRRRGRVPSGSGAGSVVWLERPAIATCRSPAASHVPIEAIDSAIAA